MNNTQHEQLFTDLTSEQAEIITAAAQGSFADANFGHANATFTATRTGSLSVSNLEVADDERDGKGVYAKFQGLSTDGKTVFTTPTKRFARRVPYRNLKGAFGGNIQAVRVTVYRDDPGSNDARAFGGWSFL